MSSFANAIDAVRAAVVLQRELAGRSLALRVRTGLSTGELIELDGEVLGPTVNRAARVREFARAGEILLSASTAAVVRAWRRHREWSCAPSARMRCADSTPPTSSSLSSPTV